MSAARQAVSLYVFWISAGLILYSYFMYPVVLLIIYSLEQIRRDLEYLPTGADRRIGHRSHDDLPEVSLIIAAYNEEKRLPEKLKNIRELQYPKRKLQVIVVSDGSTDKTNEVLLGGAGEDVQAVILGSRGGKANALNSGVVHAQHGILVFSDAATLFAPDAVIKLVRHFSKPKTGVVCGFLRFRSSDESRQTEGVYWKYETMLRLMEARLGATLTASGAIYAIRRTCFRALTPDVVIDDFVVPMRARQMGYSVVYDPEAVGIEYAAPTVSGEFTRRVRLAVGSFAAMRELISVPMNPMTRLAFASHKLLRWTVPFLLILCLLSNLVLLPAPKYAAMLACQSGFYLWALCGFTFRDHMRRVRFGLLGYFWLAMNLAFLVGFWQFATGRQHSAWQRVE